MVLSLKEIAKTIDHSLLLAAARESEITELCREARAHGFKAVCVHPCFVELCVRELHDSGVAVATVIGFPLGANCSETKLYEAEKAFTQGVREVDMVINIGALKDGKTQEIFDEIRGVVEASAVFPGALVKVIIETALLTNEEKKLACEIAADAGAQYVKTSTGFGGQGATVEDVRLMRQAVGSKMMIKASGGIRTREQAEALLDAGADRLGTSHGVRIVTETGL